MLGKVPQCYINWPCDLVPTKVGELGLIRSKENGKNSGPQRQFCLSDRDKNEDMNNY